VTERRLSDVLAASKCLICVGPGGVGKTSTAGALALASAARTERTIVLTIDPARRLANALGLPDIGNVEKVIDRDAFRRLDLDPPDGELSAMMLDIKEAWDDVVTRYHPDPRGRERLLGSSMYQALSTALAGSQEYMAMEKLYQLSHRSTDPLQRIILDTPPANHAVDFLDAPNRVVSALSNDATRWLLEPFKNGRSRSVGRRLLDAGSGFFVRTVARLTGAELLEELAHLLEGFQAMMDGFRERAEAVQALLASEQTQFVVVSSPDEEGVANATAFAAKLKERGARLGAVIFNRGHLRMTDVESILQAEHPPEAWQAVLSDAPAGLADRLLEVAQAEATAYREERERARAVGARFEVPVFMVPELADDVADLVGLDRIRQHLSRPEDVVS
jgi:anion-transporting  ArsA/GET3 family ATPase